MGSLNFTDKAHAVCVPYPAQGHINPMLMLAKVLHSRGFYITFVNTEFNHKRLLRSRGPHALDGLPSFRFETIPDGLPPTDVDATQDIPSLCDSTSKTCLPYFKQLIHKLNHSSSTSDVPPVSCIVSDGCMSFTLDAAEELGVPEVLFWTTSACGFLGYVHYRQLKEKGYTPLKDESYLANGYLDTVIDWIPAMEGIRLKDLPTFLRTTDPNFIMLDFVFRETERSRKASAIILNTFDDLEHQVLESLNSVLPPVYSVGPLHLALKHHVHDNELKQIGSNLWKEEPQCLQWLDTKDPNSVVYVNFGSITVMTSDQLIEFAWGLANSKQPFLWVIRPDLVGGESAIVPAEFVEETKDRGILATWCPQEQVLTHPSIGGFLTHSGWNSTIESISAGVPMTCWPFFAEQQTNCWYSCTKWGVGMEIDNDVNRDEVESLVRELVKGEKGKEMKKRTLDWKRKAEESIANPDGSSYRNLDKMIQVLLSPRV
ncbi:7-deoxyloganetin glucosyltransferase [Hibiscus syriacus]|uniref:Glycosyltransferase n=1 Tax=Hibiscus syriacus TaxID=106335 RepID=A0A6A3BHN2_HIBSY|nr:7-deoxyloganetin glucosyltransferase-like [Hibiscus syriacus]KAE8715411.1 7-deoxyloganetin glucosyltransferase [Hibiscus syriacus]